MNIIDKLLIIAMGLLICFTTSWDTPMIFIGLMPIIYAIIYLVLNGLEQDGY